MTKNETIKVDATVMAELEKKVEKTYVVFNGMVMSFEEYKDLIESMKD